MKNLITGVISLFLIISVQAQTAIFNSLLQTHVDKKGNVNYKNFKADLAKLDTYISYLEKTSPAKSWSKNKTKAFWINVYNAYTIKLILENYPLKSITKIKQKGKDAWNIPFVKVGGKTYTLNHVEHKILRKDFKDPRIHVGVNCASGSCPQLGNKAFTEANVESELERLMKLFVNDSSRNKLTENKVEISKIFEWFKEDFTKNGTVIDYLNRYATTKIDAKAKVRFLTYDWNLNGK